MHNEFIYANVDEQRRRIRQQSSLGGGTKKRKHEEFSKIEEKININRCCGAIVSSEI